MNNYAQNWIRLGSLGSDRVLQPIMPMRSSGDTILRTDSASLTLKGNVGSAHPPERPRLLEEPPLFPPADELWLRVPSL